MYNNAICTSLYNRRYRACKPTKPTHVARYAMMSIVRTLLLAALAFAVMQVPARADGCEAAGRVTRFVCAHCSSSDMLSSRCLLIHRAAVPRHIAASTACRAAKAGIRTIQVEARAGDVMAGAGGAAGPAPDVRHQPQGSPRNAESDRLIPCTNTILHQRHLEGCATMIP